MVVTHSLLAGACALSLTLLPWHAALSAEALTSPPSANLAMLSPGDMELRVLSPEVVEILLVSVKVSESKPPSAWDFVDKDGECKLPRNEQIQVLTGGKPVAVKAMGFKRRVLYAPISKWDLRIANWLYLQLATPVAENEVVEVKNPDKKLWSAAAPLKAKADKLRWSPALHVNQTGYLPGYPKKAMAGYFLGSLGELNIAGEGRGPRPQGALPEFEILEAGSEKSVFKGKLRPRPDRGFTFESYQRVLEADFSPFNSPGTYRLYIAGLGTSYPFVIGDAVAGAFARACALGLYHQRCGTDNALPFTRFTHAPCHMAPAEVPDTSATFESANESLAKESANFKDNPRHTARQLKNVGASLYPFARKGKVDVSRGHHDAGDYSKYTINSASFIHHLMFAADAFPGVADLDNLGLPESGDGKGDVLQEVKWEADFLAKMQDTDGGFYFLVYPREREYENDVLPDKGDPQIVFPKTTSVTAAAVAALAQCSSSPKFKKQFPKEAAQYFEVAKKGWAFLERAVAKHGKDGAYQKITHYGDEFIHDDELAWAACEMFLATRDTAHHRKLMDWFNPADPGTRRWGWWRLYDSYGSATRSYTFAARSGRVKREELSPRLLEDCENEIIAAGDDQLRRARQSAYGTSFPEETKRALSAGWYFSADAAFDLATACQLEYPVNRDPRPAMREALISNLNYEQGCNPVNVVYLTGLGWKRQREIVHQYALNDHRVLPLTGIPIGNVQAGFGWNHVYHKELDQLSFPPDGAKESPYPFYDRWGDGFNLTQEFVIVNQARALGYTCWLMAESSLKQQSWRGATAELKPATGSKGKFDLSAKDVDLSNARIVWEADKHQPRAGGPSAEFKGDMRWVEAEAQLPDGRRVFGIWPGKSPRE